MGNPKNSSGVSIFASVSCASIEFSRDTCSADLRLSDSGFCCGESSSVSAVLPVFSLSATDSEVASSIEAGGSSPEGASDCCAGPSCWVAFSVEPGALSVPVVESSFCEQPAHSNKAATRIAIFFIVYTSKKVLLIIRVGTPVVNEDKLQVANYSRLMRNRFTLGLRNDPCV